MLRYFKLFTMITLAALMVKNMAACRSNRAIPANLGPQASYQIIAVYPHDPGAYTQGLLWHNHTFIESTGLYGSSSLRVVEPESGKVKTFIPLEARFFGEGLALLNDKLYQLTWREATGFVYDLQTLKLLNTWQYPTEGWGLTTDGTNLVMSDGSDTIYFIDPKSFETIREIKVTLDDSPLSAINELEWIEGTIFANIYLTDDIARIDPQSGKVLGMLNMSGLRPAANKPEAGEVLNGIAYDPSSQRLFVTGKLWDVLYEIRLVNSPTPIKATQP